MSNQNPNDPNNLSLKGGSSSASGTTKPGFENLSSGSSSSQGGGGSGSAKPGFENLSSGSSTTQGGGGAGGGTYTVQKGDTLSGIAKDKLGSANKWREIYDANRDVIGDNPDRILPGQELKLPA